MVDDAALGLSIVRTTALGLTETTFDGGLMYVPSVAVNAKKYVSSSEKLKEK